MRWAAKAIRVGLPVLASISAPTALAVRLAERHNLTLIGYVRREHLTVYAHPERLCVGGKAVTQDAEGGNAGKKGR
jgi:formate dehydrogenase accessory protein FdhD